MYAWRLPKALSVLFSLGFAMPFGLLHGCGAFPTGAANNARLRPQDGSMPPVRSPVDEDEYENGSFDQAQWATLPVNGEIIIRGAINQTGDVDLFILGPAISGDRIIVDVTAQSGLNTVAALFDADGNLIDANDDRSYYGGLVDPYISQVIQVDTNRVFVGIAASTARYFSAGPGQYDSGAYSIRVRRETDAPVRQPRPQLVYLDFEGGSSVQIALEPVVVMRAFSAESISSRLAGQTGYIVDLVVQIMQRDLSYYNVTLVDSKHSGPPAAVHTTLYFGNENASYLGLADNVDTGNLALQQEAIIFTEDLAHWEILTPSAEEIAQAIANIAAHELGHLLGLEHAAEVGDLMATARSARQVLEVDSTYRYSRLQSDVFPVGYQNGVAVLLQNLGANPYGGGARMMLEDPTASTGSWRDEAGIPDILIEQAF